MRVAIRLKAPRRSDAPVHVRRAGVGLLAPRADGECVARECKRLAKLVTRPSIRRLDVPAAIFVNI